MEYCELKSSKICGILKTQKGTGDTDVQKIIGTLPTSPINKNIENKCNAFKFSGLEFYILSEMEKIKKERYKE